MKFCGKCDRYVQGCPHLDRRLTKRQPKWEVVVIYLAALYRHVLQVIKQDARKKGLAFTSHER